MKINNVLALITKQLQVEFILNKKAITTTEIFDDKGLFPAIIRRADQLSSFCLAQGLGVKFDKASDTLLGIVAVFDNTVSNAFRIMCITEIIHEIIEASPNPKKIPLDNLMYD